ncbi:MAG: phosphorylase family protein [Nitrospira sp.]
MEVTGEVLGERPLGARIPGGRPARSTCSSSRSIALQRVPSGCGVRSHNGKTSTKANNRPRPTGREATKHFVSYRSIGDGQSARPDPCRSAGPAVTSSAIALDMESQTIAKLCRQRNIPCLAMKAVSDGLDDDLSPILGGFDIINIPRIAMRVVTKPHT